MQIFCRKILHWVLTIPATYSNIYKSPVKTPGTLGKGSIAQLGEHLPYKQGVRSSILLISTIKKTAF